MLCKDMSLPVRRLYKTHPKAIANEYLSGYMWGLDFHGSFIIGDASLSKVLEPFKVEKDARDAVKAKVATAIKSCTTLKQLLDRFPEFTKYYPTKEEPTKNLPAVIDLAKDLKALGWPKGKVTK
jgi:phosphoglycolate phosphatase-like HAD superfamily hydrolase